MAIAINRMIDAVSSLASGVSPPKKKADSAVTAYAHWDTGRYASAPQRVNPGGPAIAGRNLERALQAQQTLSSIANSAVGTGGLPVANNIIGNGGLLEANNAIAASVPQDPIESVGSWTSRPPSSTCPVVDMDITDPTPVSGNSPPLYKPVACRPLSVLPRVHPLFLWPVDGKVNKTTHLDAAEVYAGIGFSDSDEDVTVRKMLRRLDLVLGSFEGLNI